MGIKRAYDRIEKERYSHEEDVWNYDAKNVAYGLELAMDILEDECPEVESVENQTQFKRNSNAISDIHMDVLTILDSLPAVDSYEIALEGLMNAESDDEDVNEILGEIKEIQTREEFIESLNKLLYLLKQKEESNG